MKKNQSYGHFEWKYKREINEKTFLWKKKVWNKTRTEDGKEKHFKPRWILLKKLFIVKFLPVQKK